MATLNKPLGPHNGYGPIEAVIQGIDKGLHALGHRSIVACSGDGLVAGEKFETVPETVGAYCAGDTATSQARLAVHLAQSLRRASRQDIDVVHMHEWYERVLLGEFDPPKPIVMTLHVPAEHSGMADFRERHPERPLWSRPSLHFVAISEHQRRQYSPLVPVEHTIPHGIDVAAYEYTPRADPGKYLFSIGRLTEVKGQDTAIEVAKRAGTPLILAGCVQNKAEDRAFFAKIQASIDLTVDVSQYPVDEHYFERVIQPILASGKQTIYIGELNDAAKKHWYRHALATVFPIRWSEPFGMVLIESMASGTPVVAFGKGSVPEIVVDGKTGFVVDSLDAMVRAVKDVHRLERGDSRKHVERHFSIEVMARRYARLYEEVSAGHPALVPVRPSLRTPNARPLARRIPAGT